MPRSTKKNTGAFEFVIKKGIPMPKRNSPLDRFPWMKLEVDECFFVPRTIDGDDISMQKFSMRMQSRAKCASDKHKRVFRSRQATEDGVEGVRIWRIE